MLIFMKNANENLLALAPRTTAASLDETFRKLSKRVRDDPHLSFAFCISMNLRDRKWRHLTTTIAN
uniref:Uncharacterized protein n=1 Tax=Strigamia maritima TaxID=126957 RepID=T1JHB4_STRMM